jgi:hypothetical protein
MARARGYRKKKPMTTKRRTTRNYKKKTSIPRNKLTQRVIGFKRDFELPVVALENSDSWPAGWYRGADNNVVSTMVFNLQQLPGYSEFKNLFGHYKLNHVVMKIYPTTSEIVSQNINESIPTGALGVSNFTITTWRNQTGQPLGPTWSDALMNQIPAKKTRLFPRAKPYIISCKLNQLTATYNQSQTDHTVEVNDTSGTAVNVLQPYNVDYGVTKPRYLNTVEDSTPHYGLNMMFKKLDDSYFDVLSPRLKIYYTMFFTCKGVR